MGRTRQRSASMQRLLQDVRFGLRMLARSRGFTFVAVVTLALGIGTSSAVFSAAEAALLRSWPAKSPEKLAKIVATTPQGRGDWFSYPDYVDLSEQSRSLEGVVAWSRHGHSLRVGPESQFVLDDWDSPNYFAVLGVSTQLGRTFSGTPNSPSEPVVVISD